MSESPLHDYAVSRAVAAPPTGNTVPQNGIQMEYLSLREETLKRGESRQQQLSITLTIAGAFLGIGWGTGGAVALFIFPPLAALLATGWAQNEIRIRQINSYIRDVLEPRIPGLGWEGYSRQRDRRLAMGGLSIELLAIGGIFILTQGLAMLLGLFRFDPANPLEYVLFGVDILAVIALFFLINLIRRESSA